MLSIIYIMRNSNPAKPVLKKYATARYSLTKTLKTLDSNAFFPVKSARFFECALNLNIIFKGFNYYEKKSS